jgi:hypothetical protein
MIGLAVALIPLVFAFVGIAGELNSTELIGLGHRWR